MEISIIPSTALFCFKDPSSLKSFLTQRFSKDKYAILKNYKREVPALQSDYLKHTQGCQNGTGQSEVVQVYHGRL